MTYKALEHLLILRSNWSSQIYWGFRHMEVILDLCPFAYLVAQGLSFIAIKIQCNYFNILIPLVPLSPSMAFFPTMSRLIVSSSLGSQDITEGQNCTKPWQE
jgi:hypothetical protein